MDAETATRARPRFAPVTGRPLQGRAVTHEKAVFDACAFICAGGCTSMP